RIGYMSFKTVLISLTSCHHLSSALCFSDVLGATLPLPFLPSYPRHALFFDFSCASQTDLLLLFIELLVIFPLLTKNGS
ncbi:hypothetical protein BDQ17DRAFT_1385188, partial [Cyathus striatus]